MSSQFDDDPDGTVSGLIESLSLRLGFKEMEEDAILTPESEVLGGIGVGNGNERCSVIYSCSEDHDSYDDSYARHSDDDMYFSDTVEVGSYGDDDGDGNGDEHDESGSYGAERGSADLGGDDNYMRNSESGDVYFADSEQGRDSMDGDDDDDDDDSGEVYYGTDSSEDNSLDDSEGDVEVRSFFPCPFCYTDIEVHALCIHFQQEHCIDVKNSVCPLCAGNLDGDVTRHFMVHHRTSMKRRRKLVRPGSSSLTVLGKELSSFLGYPGNSQTLADLPSDVLDKQDSPQRKFLDEKASNLSEAKSSELLQDHAQKQELETLRQRAAFVQELIASTIL